MTNFGTLSRELKGKGFKVDRIVDPLGMSIDEKIKPLVIALNYKSYTTSGSCEGHSLAEKEKRLKGKVDLGEAKLVFRAERGLVYQFYKSNGKPYKNTKTFNESPWVQIKPSGNQLEKIAVILDEHNKRSNVYWRRENFSDDTCRIETVPRYGLETMQADVLLLAEHVLEFG